MNNIVLFGGTFNPIHNGHVFIVKECIKRISMEKLFIIPAKIPPHKKNNEDIIDGIHRINMCKLAFENISKSEVSDFELKSLGVSYTINTVIHFQYFLKKSKMFLLMGEDMFYTFETWKDYKKILDMVSLIVIPRGIDSLIKSNNITRNINILNVAAPNISSTQIRKNIACGKSINDLVPDKVVSYIKKNKLYL